MKPTKLLLAALLVAGSTGLAGAAFAQEVTITPEAREKFKAGVALLKDPDGARYEEAYLAFKAAYALSPAPNILGNLGLCALKLERDGEAIEAYSTYLAKGTGLGDEEKAQIETDVRTLKSTLVSVTLKVEPAGASILDERIPSRGEPVRNRYTPTNGTATMGVRAGTHRFTVSMAGYADQVVELELAPGQSVTKEIRLEVPATPPPGSGAGAGAGAGAGGGGAPAPVEMERPIPVGVWVGLGITGALAIGTGVVGGLAMANKSDFDAANDGSDPAAAQDLKDSGQALNITTDVLLGSTVAAAAVTTILFFTRPEVPKEKGVSVRVVPTGAGLAVVGAF